MYTHTNTHRWSHTDISDPLSSSTTGYIVLILSRFHSHNFFLRWRETWTEFVFLIDDNWFLQIIKKKGSVDSDFGPLPSDLTAEMDFVGESAVALSLSLFTEYLSQLAFPSKTVVPNCADSMPPVNPFLFGVSPSLSQTWIHLQGHSVWRGGGGVGLRGILCAVNLSRGVSHATTEKATESLERARTLSSHVLSRLSPTHSHKLQRTASRVTH